jgi:hypothetical protein
VNTPACAVCGGAAKSVDADAVWAAGTGWVVGASTGLG